MDHLLALDLWAGGSLLAIDPGHPYPFALNMKSAQFSVTGEGRVLKPFDLSGLELQVAARGQDTADLFYLTQLALSNLPPYEFRGATLRGPWGAPTSAAPSTLMPRESAPRSWPSCPPGIWF